MRAWTKEGTEDFSDQLTVNRRINLLGLISFSPPAEGCRCGLTRQRARVLLPIIRQSSFPCRQSKDYFHSITIQAILMKRSSILFN